MWSKRKLMSMLKEFSEEDLEVAWEYLHNKQTLLLKLKAEEISTEEAWQKKDIIESHHNRETKRFEAIQQRRRGMVQLKSEEVPS